jgi:hypothetical protein
MKQMVFDFKQTCEKLSKHDYIIDTTLPEFKSLQKEFYNFKFAVDKELDRKPDLDFINRGTVSDTMGQGKHINDNINGEDKE